MEPRSTAQRCVADVLESGLLWVSESILWVAPGVRAASSHGHRAAAQREGSKHDDLFGGAFGAARKCANTAGFLLRPAA